jgi:hypothetical protein
MTLQDEKHLPFEPYDFTDVNLRTARRSAEPSLPIILLSAAGGIAGGILGLYVAYIVLDLSPQLTAAVTTLALCISLGSVGALLSSLTASRAAFGNIALSCGLVVLTLLFFSLCMLAGAMTATLILTWGS